MLEDELKISIHRTPAYHSVVNGQIERFYSTLGEIMRCLNTDKLSRNFEELIERAVNEYNHTIHSTTKKKTGRIVL